MNTEKQKDICVANVEEFLAIIYKNYSRLHPNSFYEKQKVFFRGQNVSDFELVPSLSRCVNSRQNPNLMYSRFENEMIQSAKLQNPEEFSNDIYPINMLARMQHFGLPTRLLDITENSLVALFFACQGQENKDGAVFCFLKEQKEINTVYSLSPNMIAYLYNYSGLTQININDFWNDIRYESFIPKKYADYKYEMSNIDIIRERIKHPCFVLPEMLTEREKRQQAAFIVFPNRIEDQYITDGIYCNMMYDNKITISSKGKRKIMRQLELIGISKQFLFPETDSKCSAIKKGIEANISDFEFEQ